LSGQRATVRLDKWLWHARFFRTRGVATDEVASGHVRVNGVRTVKPAYAVGAGDTLTFPQGARIRVVRILETALRRGPASDAQQLYLDLDGPVAAAPSPLE
jgi:ribosome-associated heat shock protein Hsp15